MLNNNERSILIIYYVNWINMIMCKTLFLFTIWNLTNNFKLMEQKNNILRSRKQYQLSPFRYTTMLVRMIYGPHHIQIYYLPWQKCIQIGRANGLLCLPLVLLNLLKIQLLHGAFLLALDCNVEDKTRRRHCDKGAAILIEHECKSNADWLLHIPRIF